MKLRTFFHRLFSILAVVGLLVAPVAASQGATAMIRMSAGTSDMQSMSMPDGMPCCPEQGPVAPDQQKSCPLAVSCVADSVSNAPTAVAFMLSMTSGQAIALYNDLERDILPQSPPLRPPRT